VAAPLSFDLLLFGATGDLATRKLLPGLYRCHANGQFGPAARVLAVSHRGLSREEFIARAHEAVQTHVFGGFSEQTWATFAQQLDYVQVDARSDDDYRRLREKLAGREDVVRANFLSTSSLLFADICTRLGAHHLVTPLSRVVLEKPLGEDLISAERINRDIGAVFTEQQIFRIDHYLGKETVQNLMALRFGNALFEPLWRRGRIVDVQITVAEQIGLEGRASFYDQTGALRDMVQSHLLQLLCILAMEPPTSSRPDDVRDEKLKVLRALRPLTGKDVIENTVRGQYQSGASDGKPVVGYLEEKGVPPGSQTETFVAIRAAIDSWRWSGVPFYLRTGKRLQKKLAEIVVTFDEVPHAIFDRPNSALARNRLVIQLQPEEEITLTILAKTPGEGMRLQPVDLNLSFAEAFKQPQVDAYERLLMDVLRGNLTLFMRRDELDAAWQWIDPIHAAWKEYDVRPRPYIAGTWGPAASSALISRDGLAWSEEL
jgi:glucose-6-phosphate 1-dehydrogenase